MSPIATHLRFIPCFFLLFTLCNSSIAQSDANVIVVNNAKIPVASEPQLSAANCIFSLLFIGNQVCDDNGTPNDPTDDTFTFDFNVDYPMSTGTTWTATDPNGTTGTYGVLTTFGPYLVANGIVFFDVCDDNDPSCCASFGVGPGSNCLPASCNIQNAGLGSVACDDNGTPTDASDDFIVFDLDPTGVGLATGYNVSAPGYTITPGSGTYGAPNTFNLNTGSAGGGDISVTITDQNDPNCFITIIIPDPGTCSSAPVCNITSAGLGSVTCNDFGTPNSPGDDFLEIEFNPTGTGLSGSYIVTSPLLSVSPGFANYGSPAIQQFLNAGSNPGVDIPITITDANDPNCSITILVPNIAPCSTPVCSITASLVNNFICDDGGTPNDPTDDTFTFEVLVDGTGTGSSWTADDPNFTSGAYGVPVSMGPYLVSNGILNLTFTDDSNSGCTASLLVDPSGCIPSCNLQNAGLGVVACDDNGTPTDASDDFIVFDLDPTGVGLATGYNVSAPGYTITPGSGTYGAPNSFNLNTGSAGGGDVSVTITDQNDPNCFITIIIPDPGTCSSAPVCNITSAGLGSVTCNDFGTPNSPGDDFLEIEFNPTGTGLSGTYIVSSPLLSVSPGFANYGSPAIQQFLNAGSNPGVDIPITITDANDPNCSITILVPNIAPCSTPVCSITASLVNNFICDDGGTPNDPTDDTFTFEVLVDGTGTGTSWTADDPNFTSGAYGVPVSMGPYLVSNGILNLTFTDDSNSGCTASLLVDPSGCIPSCNLQNAGLGVVACDDNGTPTDATDDFIVFDLDPTGVGLATGYNVSAPGYTITPGSGTYGAPNSFNLNTGSAGGGDVSVTITDQNDPNCFITITVSDPGTCSNAPVCNITSAGLGSITCNDFGTPNSPGDDFLEIEFNPTGTGLSGTYIVSSPLLSVSPGFANYGSPAIQQFLNAGSNPGVDIPITITDANDPNCSITILVPNIAPCSTPVCEISATISNTQCNDNGTPSDPSDDTFTFELEVNGQNTSTGWTAGGLSGAYNAAVLAGPYPISGGAVTLTIIDDNDPNCTTSVTVTAPASCSNSCSISATATAALCNDNGTPSDPSDDTFTFELEVNGQNTSTGWTAGGLSGAYSAPVLAGPYPISGGAVTLTITDDNDPNCTTSITVTPPASCSSSCSISATVNAALCNDNGTPSDQSDDTFTFEIEVTGQNTSTGWTAGGLSGAYNAAVLAGPYPISGGSVTLTIIDDNDPNCTTSITVTAPASCSNSCSISATATAALCNDNGTPTDPSDDTFTFEVEVTGQNTSTGWTAGGLSGDYTASVIAGPYPISGGAVTLTIVDNNDPNCTTTVTVAPPISCSSTCSIGATATASLCNDNGTPSDPSDDTFTFEVEVTGQNTSTGWTAGGLSGDYTASVIAGPYPISGGAVTLTIVDNNDPNCTTSITVTAPASCSNSCSISATATAALCNDNGTPSDPSDDTFTFEIEVTGQNTSTGWTAGGLSGAYNAAVLAGPYPISGGAVTLTIIDDNDPNCTTSVTVTAQASCSSSCSISATATAALCNDNGTPSDPSDDTFTFEIEVTGQNTSTGWTAGGLSGDYTASVIAGPYPISGGAVTLTIVDNNDPNCTTSITVTAPVSCSNSCSISATATAALCNDNGTPSDPSDDTFTFEVEVTGQNTSTGWTAGGLSGDYTASVIAGPYPISGGAVTLTIIDDNDPNCTTSVTVTAPAGCSNSCSISATATAALCNDNGTPSDPSDDTFTFELEVNGQNTSAGWTAGGLSGSYTASVIAGPYSISGGAVTLTITDDNDPNCTTSITVTAPASCSSSCSISATATAALCNDNGTPSDPSDDTFTFGLEVNGQNTSAGWTAGGLSGSYTASVIAGPYSISGGAVTLTITDDNDPNCTTSLGVAPPATCSENCPIPDTIYTSQIICSSMDRIVFDTIFLLGSTNCDSIVEVISTEYVAPDITPLETTTCFAEDERIDTIILQNNLGCDSLVLTEFVYRPFGVRVDPTGPSCIENQDGLFRIDVFSSEDFPLVLTLNDQPLGEFTNSPIIIGQLEEGLYTIRLENRQGCIFEETYQLVGNPSPVVSLGDDLTIVLGDVYTLLANTSLRDGQYNWVGNDIDTTCTDCGSLQVRPLNNRTYRLTVSDSTGCSGSDEITIFVQPDRRVYIPNVFSPNNDGANDIFMIYGASQQIEEIELLRVFDRWGALLFESRSTLPNDPTSGWNGMYRGQSLNPGVFVYYAQIRFIDGSTKLYQGDIAIVK